MLEDLLGRSATLVIRRFGSPGAYLAQPAPAPAAASEAAAVAPPPKTDDRDVVLLLGSEIPEGAKEGDVIDVFLYRDSEGRLLATTRVPKLELGDVAFLEVTECTEFGAFVNWGLAKDLLVPFKEQTVELHAGTRHPIGLYIDQTGRLAGTMRVSEMLAGDRVEWQLDEWVEGEAWRNDPDIGLFVILEKSFVGLVPASEPHTLSRGESARFRVTNVLPDGKIELSLRGHAHEERGSDGQKILAALARPGAPSIGDKSSPEEIRDRFGLSKKAFKRAVGGLLKSGAIDIDDEGLIHVKKR